MVFIVVGLLNLHVLVIGLSLALVYLTYLYFVFKRSAAATAQTAKVKASKHLAESKPIDDILLVDVDVKDVYNTGSPRDPKHVSMDLKHTMRRSRLASQFDNESVA